VNGPSAASTTASSPAGSRATRLVHAFTAPLAYLFRPYVVYRSKPAGVGALANRGVDGSGSAPSGDSP
jgi:Nitrate reductase gamma subunit